MKKDIQALKDLSEQLDAAEKIQPRIDLQKLRDRSEYITELKHGEADLIIWNYNHRCQFDNIWDEYTKIARGLITDSAGNVIARPFPKFFNLDQIEETKIENLPSEIPQVYEKLDGSLGILYARNDKYYIATRGSFSSEQAVWATEWFRKNLGDREFDSSYTYLFEIIYPSNRIVVDYGEKEDLILLAVINTADGAEKDYTAEAERLNLSYTKKFTGGIDEALKAVTEMGDNEEGVVAKYSNGLRVKIKSDEYKRLHRLLTGFSSKSIWEFLSDNQPLDKLLERVPDEFYEWVKKTKSDLEASYVRLNEATYAALRNVKDLPDRKEQALYLKEHHPDVMAFVFGVLDGRNMSKEIWKRVKPTYAKPFKTDIDS